MRDTINHPTVSHPFPAKGVIVALAALFFALSLSPLAAQTPQDHVQQGIFCLAAAYFDQAVAEFTRAIALNPKYAVAYRFRGMAYYYKTDYDQAIADYNQAIALDPKDFRAYSSRGSAYYDKKDYTKARSDYNQALGLDPNDPDAKDGLAKLDADGR
jgi:Flp pilus assembly protein TadD